MARMLGSYRTLIRNRRTGAHAGVDGSARSRKRAEQRKAEREIATGMSELRIVAERRYQGDPDMEIVVLGADSLDALKVTHGRYFHTAAELAERMRDACDA